MKFAFQKLRLEANSLYSLISTWAEMQLRITEDSATIIGYGYTYDIAGAFTMLVLDWEAVIHLPKDEIGLKPGEYYLARPRSPKADKGDPGGDLYAFRDQQRFLLTDRPVVVEVVSAPEDWEEL